MSRVSVPRLTCAMRTLEALTADPAEIRRATVGTTQISAISTAAPTAPMTIQRLCERTGSIRRSWAEVSRIIVAGVLAQISAQCATEALSNTCAKRQMKRNRLIFIEKLGGC